MKQEKTVGDKIIAFISCFGPFIAFLAIQLFIGVALGITVLVVIMLEKGGVTSTTVEYMERIMGSLNFYILLACTLATTCCGYAWFRYGYKEEYDYKVTEVASGKDIAYIIGMALAATFATDVVVYIIAAIAPKAIENYAELVNSAGIGNSAITFMIAAFLAPVGEECFYRGIILRKAEKAFTFVMANIIQAALFGIMHGNLVQGAYAFALGLILGYVYHKYQSLVIPILFHMSFNIFGQTLPFLTAEIPMPLNLLLVATSVVLLALCLLGVSKRTIHPKKC